MVAAVLLPVPGSTGNQMRHCILGVHLFVMFQHNGILICTDECLQMLQKMCLLMWLCIQAVWCHEFVVF